MDENKPADLDKWKAVFTNISKLQKLPTEEQERLFEELFSIPEKAESTSKTKDGEASKLGIAKKMKQKEFSVEQIIKLTGLTEVEIKEL